MRKTIPLLAGLLLQASLCIAGNGESTEVSVTPDIAPDAMDVVTSYDVPYVAAVLDRKTDPGQTLDIYRPVNTELPPVILYLHGGDWAFGDKKDVHLMPFYFATKGIAFVSMNYRLRWDYKVYDQVTDVVAAVKWLAEHGEEHGLDGSRVVLLGNMSGGHLASLAITNSAFMKAESFSGDNIKAVVSLDSVSYDINRLMKELGSFIERQKHELIFTGDKKVWTAASPITHVEKSRTLKPFALLYSPGNEAALLQAKGFARKLSDAEVPVIMVAGAAESPKTIAEQIGAADSIATGALMAFLRAQL